MVQLRRFSEREEHLLDRPVRFTPHALEKLDLVADQGFDVDTGVVTEYVRNPPRIYFGSNNLPIVHVPLDAEHILRVVFTDVAELVVVTVYPCRRDRYEL